MKYLFSTILIALLLIPSQSVKGQSYTASDGYVEFISRAPLLEFKGVSDHLTGLVDTDENLIDFYVDLNTIDTGIELRNQHMRNSYLKTEQCPFAEFTGKLSTPFESDLYEAQKVSASGTFIVNCVEREIDVFGTLKPTENGLQLEAQFEILLNDYDIEKPRVIFYELADEQVINLSILLKEDQ